MLAFVADEFSGLFLHPSLFSGKHSRSAQTTNDVLSDFWYWLNSNILASSERIIILQKSLFSHALLRELSLLFVLKNEGNLGNKITVMFRSYSS